MSLRSLRSRLTLHWAFAVLIALAPSVAWAGGNNNNGFFNRAVGGVRIDPTGVVSEPAPKDLAELTQRLKDEFKAPATELQQPVQLRMFSLRAAEEAIRQSGVEFCFDLPDEIRFMAGLQRVQYVLIYPEQNDIVLAGPGEGWKLDAHGNYVGVTTGRPVLRLEDFLLAMRTTENARQGGISVSIDPTAEGRQRLDQLLSAQRTFTPDVLDRIEKALGPQQISIQGVPDTSRFARTLVASDYKMKRIAMALQKSPIDGLPSYVSMLKGRPDNMMPRWWMACNYEPIAKSPDGLTWEIRGQGVKVLTEDEIIGADGSVTGSGKANPAAQKWADLMTAKYDELSVKEPVFGELRNLMDLCVVAALISKEDLLTKANCQLPVLSGADSKLGLATWMAPRHVDTQCSATKKGRDFIITASGGVQITSWQVADKTEEVPAIAEVHAKAAPKSSERIYW